MTLTQALTALDLANEIRLDAAQLRREITAGELTIREALADPRSQSLTALRLLTAQHRWGRARAMKILTEIPVSETRRVRDLTPRQADAIADLVEQREYVSPFPTGAAA